HLDRVRVGATVVSGYHKETIPDGRAIGRGMRHVRIWPGAPGIRGYIIDVSRKISSTGSSQRCEGSVRSKLRIPASSQEGVAATDQVVLAVCVGRGSHAVRYRQRSQRRPSVTYYVVAVMVGRADPVPKAAHQV